MGLEYFTSERFIHDDLLRRAQRTVDKLYEIWKRSGRLPPFVFTWPSEPVKDDHGVPIEDICALSLPPDKTLHRDLIRQLIVRTKAYAVLVGEQDMERILAILESHHGTRSWNIPIYRSGDVRYLAPAVIADNKESLGLLWSAKKSMA